MALESTSYEVNGHEFVLGLDWRVISSKKEVGALARESETKYGLVRTVESHKGEEASLRLGLADREAVGQLSGAAALASMAPNVLLVQPIGEDRYWLVFVTRGQVMPRTDFVGALDQVKQRMTDVLSSHSAAEEGLLLCAPGIRRDADFEKFNDTDFARLIKEYKPESSERIKRVVAPISPKQAVVIAAIVVAGIVAYKIWQGHSSPKIQRVVQTVVHHAPVPLTRDQQFQKLAVVVAPTLEGHAPDTVTGYFSHTLKRYWPAADGWTLTSITVTPGTGATLQFDNPDQLSVLSFKQFVGDAGSVSFSPDGEHATVTVPWSDPETGEDNANLATVLEGAKGVDLKLASDFQTHAVKYTLTQGSLALPKNGTSPQAALGLAPNQPIPLDLYSLKATVPLWNLSHVARVMAAYPTVGLSELVLHIQSATAQTVTLTGVLYEAQ